MSLRGTTFAGIRVAKPGKHRICVVADRETKLQVTLVPVRRTSAFVSAVQNDSEVVVTLCGNTSRIVGLSLEDHSQERSEVHPIPVEDMAFESSKTETGHIIARCVVRRRLAFDTVKVVFETEDGTRVCEAGPVVQGIAAQSRLATGQQPAIR